MCGRQMMKKIFLTVLFLFVAWLPIVGHCISYKNIGTSQEDLDTPLTNPNSIPAKKTAEENNFTNFSSVLFFSAGMIVWAISSFMGCYYLLQWMRKIELLLQRNRNYNDDLKNMITYTICNKMEEITCYNKKIGSEIEKINKELIRQFGEFRRIQCNLDDIMRQTSQIGSKMRSSDLFYSRNVAPIEKAPVLPLKVSPPPSRANEQSKEMLIQYHEIAFRPRIDRKKLLMVFKQTYKVQEFLCLNMDERMKDPTKVANLKDVDEDGDFLAIPFKQNFYWILPSPCTHYDTVLHKGYAQDVFNTNFSSGLYDIVKVINPAVFLHQDKTWQFIQKGELDLQS